MRNQLTRLLSSTTALIVFSCAGPVFSQDSTPNSSLRLYRNPSARFQAMMPVGTQHNKPRPGATQHQFLSGTPAGVYMVAYEDYPKLDLTSPNAAEKAYTRARDGFQQAIGGTQTTYRTRELNGVKGREMEFTIPARSGKAKSRMFFVGQRWYHVFVMGTPDFVDSPDAKRFLDSFKVIPQGE